MASLVVQAPQNEPVTLQQAKKHCRVTIDDDDDLILGYVAAAREYVEGFCRKTLLTTTLVYALDAFPYRSRYAGWHRPLHEYQGLQVVRHHNDNIIRIPRPPLQRIIQVTYIDEAQVTRTLAPALYGVDVISQPGKLFLLEGAFWPTTVLQPNAVQIEFEAGYKTTAEVPRTLRTAILLLVAHLYENREATAEKVLQEIPLAVKSMLWLNRNMEAA